MESNRRAGNGVPGTGLKVGVLGRDGFGVVGEEQYLGECTEAQEKKIGGLGGIWETRSAINREMEVSEYNYTYVYI